MIYTAYECPDCEVKGISEDDPPMCWCCNTTSIRVTARPTQINQGYPFVVPNAVDRAEP